MKLIVKKSICPDCFRPFITLQAMKSHRKSPKCQKKKVFEVNEDCDKANQISESKKTKEVPTEHKKKPISKKKKRKMKEAYEYNFKFVSSAIRVEKSSLYS